MNWRWIAVTALLAAVVIGYGALTRRDASRVTAANPPAQPGYYLKDAIVSRTQKDGSLSMRLIAARVEQDTRDDSIKMNDVKVNYFRTRETEWVLTAKRGSVPADSRVVQLEGEVELRPANAPT